MPLNHDAIGRAYPAGPPFAVTHSRVVDFALAIGDETVSAQPAFEIPVPPTFAYVASLKARRALLDDPSLGLDYGRSVHGEQNFEYARPIRVGDVLTTQCTVVDMTLRGANEILTWREEIRAADGELVCTTVGSIVSRGTAS